ncbi:DUF6907 domain-containing protein [Streptomyces syringium]|uniref:DUF6907 domain-containing protein n=1 Tax=Streptomyces syringium TaxID=76729 RepID=UPI0037D71B39
MSLANSSFSDLPAAVPAQPSGSAASSRTWVRKIAGGGRIVESCPEWCGMTHWNDQDGALDDLAHCSADVSVKVPVFDAAEGTLALPILAARIAVDPYSEDPARCVPHVDFEPAPDDMVECLSPEGFAEIIAQVRAHCDRLDEVLARLVAARAGFGVE